MHLSFRIPLQPQRASLIQVIITQIIFSLDLVTLHPLNVDTTDLHLAQVFEASQQELQQVEAPLAGLLEVLQEA
jgi:hypothetical protein